MYWKMIELNELCVCVYVHVGQCPVCAQCPRSVYSTYLVSVCVLILSPPKGTAPSERHFPGVPNLQLICYSLWLLICLRGACWRRIGDVRSVTIAQEMQLREKCWGTPRGKVTSQSSPLSSYNPMTHKTLNIHTHTQSHSSLHECLYLRCLDQ